MSIHIFHKWTWQRESTHTEYVDESDSLGDTYTQIYHRFVCHCGAIKTVREKS